MTKLKEAIYETTMKGLVFSDGEVEFTIYKTDVEELLKVAEDENAEWIDIAWAIQNYVNAAMKTVKHCAEPSGTTNDADDWRALEPVMSNE